MRDRAWRRAQRARWINRRLDIIKNVWLQEPWPWLCNGAKLDKHNLTCRPRCGLCKPWKRWGAARPRWDWQEHMPL